MRKYTDAKLAGLLAGLSAGDVPRCDWLPHCDEPANESGLCDEHEAKDRLIRMAWSIGLRPERRSTERP